MRKWLLFLVVSQGLVAIALGSYEVWGHGVASIVTGGCLLGVGAAMWFRRGWL